jgi:hypothetical protein
MNIIRLSEAKDYNPRTIIDCYINVGEISSIQECVVGERSSGSKIMLNNSHIIKVFEDPTTVYNLIQEILQGKNDEN